MASHNIAALHDRIDEEHFELRLHASAITALQRKVDELEAAVRELRVEAFGDARSYKLRRNHPAKLSTLRP